jgi:hypothetical protein
MRRRASKWDRATVIALGVAATLACSGCAVGTGDEEPGVEAVGSAASRAPVQATAPSAAPSAGAGTTAPANVGIKAAGLSPTPVPWHPADPVTIDGTGSGTPSTTGATK